MSSVRKLCFLFLWAKTESHNQVNFIQLKYCCCICPFKCIYVMFHPLRIFFLSLPSVCFQISTSSFLRSLSLIHCILKMRKQSNFCIVIPLQHDTIDMIHTICSLDILTEPLFLLGFTLQMHLWYYNSRKYQMASLYVNVFLYKLFKTHNEKKEEKKKALLYEDKKPFLEVIAKFDYKLRLSNDCVMKVNRPCSFSGYEGLWRNVIWWTNIWDELSRHHVSYRTWPCQLLFFFNWWRQPCLSYGSRFIEVSTSIFFPSALSVSVFHSEGF